MDPLRAQMQIEMDQLGASLRDGEFSIAISGAEAELCVKALHLAFCIVVSQYAPKPYSDVASQEASTSAKDVVRSVAKAVAAKCPDEDRVAKIVCQSMTALKFRLFEHLNALKSQARQSATKQSDQH